MEQLSLQNIMRVLLPTYVLKSKKKSHSFSEFSWFFNDEPVVPGQPGWEDAEIHHSRKMSTLIIPFAREYHMGKYTLVAENPLGHAVSNADLIVRKKQFPPVFWQRLYNYEAESGMNLFISG